LEPKALIQKDGHKGVVSAPDNRHAKEAKTEKEGSAVIEFHVVVAPRSRRAVEYTLLVRRCKSARAWQARAFAKSGGSPKAWWWPGHGAAVTRPPPIFCEVSGSGFARPGNPAPRRAPSQWTLRRLL